MNSPIVQPQPPPGHPRTLGWLGTSALAMGGSNQSLFLITALFVGQGAIPGQGSAAVPLLIAGLILAWMAAPAWTELVSMYPNRVGGIAASCSEAFQPYSPVLANLTGVCYWWGWVPTCGLTAILSASAIHAWYLPEIPIPAIACALVLAFTAVNLLGVHWAARVAIPIATASALLALLSGLIPIFTGCVDWQRATDFDLTVPFEGLFGQITSAMAGLYLIGFAAPAFEAAACHVGETVHPERNVPRAMFASAAMASIYFVLLPVVWLGTLGPVELGRDLIRSLGPTYEPLLGAGARAAAIWFMMFNMFHGTLQPLAGASRTIAQLSEDGLLPRTLARRSRRDVPWVATALTAAMAILFLLIGDPIWLIAAANFTYLIGICLPNVAVWLLRKDAPERHRPYTAPRGFIGAGLAAAAIWGVSAVLGFQQFGMQTVVFGIFFAYSGSMLYAWRKYRDRREQGLPGVAQTLHIKLTGAMLLVLALDGAGYLIAVSHISREHVTLITILEDIFVVVAILSITVGLVLPGMIAHSAVAVADAATRIARGTIADFSAAMRALGRGDLDAVFARPDFIPIKVYSRDEMGAMAVSFNALQEEIGRAVESLDGARRELAHQARHDSLTGLVNRREFERRLDLCWQRDPSATGDHAVLFMDLDQFKVVNDTCGHVAGDEMLRQIGSVLRTVVRTQDVLARLGGDEFAVLLVGCGVGEAQTIAERFIRAIQDFSFLWQSHVFRVSVSVGLVAFSSGTMRPLDVLRAADQACYLAKDRGRNRLHVYQPSDAEARGRLDEVTWVGELHKALDEGRFCLYAQDILPVAPESGRHGAHREILLRILAEDGRVVEPMAFIPSAERYGLMGRIDRWVISTAFAHLVTRLRDDPDAAGSVWAINLSGASIGEPAMLDFIRGAFHDHGLPAAAICFEITETVAIANLADAGHFVKSLKELGCRFALDDFGSGMSSFAYLKYLPVDYLKVDGAFVRDIASDPIDRAMVEAINRVGHVMGIETIAEFVDREPTLEVLREIGVDHAQGYALAEPELLVPARARDPAQAGLRA
ncbi:MAG: amino acid permease [Gammaproteobacteria bacterium]